MKRLSLVFIVSVFIFFSTSQAVYGQNNGAFDQALQQYLLDLETYNRERSEYQLARSQYLRLQTLSLQNKAREETLQMLQSRDQVVISYLTALKSRLNSVTAVEEATRDLLSSQIDEEILWFTAHKENLVTAGSLDDLVNDSNEARNHYNTLAPLIYETLSRIPYARVDRLQERINENFLSIKEKIALIRAETRPDYQLTSRKLESVDRWVLQTEGKLQRSEEKLLETQGTIDSLGISSAGFEGAIKTNGSILVQLDISLADLKEASLSIREIIKELKTK